MKLTKGIKILLKDLSDRKWHVYFKLPKGVSAYTVDLCVELGIVRTKRVIVGDYGDEQDYLTALRITRLGITTLNEKNSSFAKSTSKEVFFNL